MKARSKSKELLKVALVCVLSIGMFSAAFVGFNQLIFAAATNEPTPLPPVVATAENESVPLPSVATTAETAHETFVSPVFTLIDGTNPHIFPQPAAALSMQEAADLGARYIWDVFGVSIEGMYVEMHFADHERQTTTWWTGQVFIEDPANPTLRYIDHPNGAEFGRPTRTALNLYMFTINGITGERIDISYQGARLPVRYDSDVDARIDTDARINSGNEMRNAMLESGWFDMTLDEQIIFVGLDSEALNAYTQAAVHFAEAQFNPVGTADVRLETLRVIFTDVNTVYLEGFSFITTSASGREAHIIFPATDSTLQWINITTQHNDFVPFDDDGRGRR